MRHADTGRQGFTRNSKGNVIAGAGCSILGQWDIRYTYFFFIRGGRHVETEGMRLTIARFSLPLRDLSGIYCLDSLKIASTDSHVESSSGRIGLLGVIPRWM